MKLPSWKPDALAAHLWTVSPALRHRLRRHQPAPGQPWSWTLSVAGRGPVSLTGELHLVPGAEELVVMLHGLGGDIDSEYMISGLNALVSQGFSVLRTHLRGADGGGDFYHAGLTDDVHALARELPLHGARRLWLLGYSLGGHVVLKAATEDLDERVKGVVAISPPVDLKATQVHLDTVALPIYRLYMLDALKDMYAQIARQAPVPTPVSRLKRVRTILEWDRLTVAPRFGYDGPDDYYRQNSVAFRLARLGRPALMLSAEHDPFIPAGALRQAEAAGLPAELTVRWSQRGGHVGYPPGQRPELEAVAWMRAVAAGATSSARR